MGKVRDENKEGRQKMEDGRWKIKNKKIDFYIIPPLALMLISQE